MQSDFFPDREADMLSWSRNFREHLEADYAALGVSLEQMQRYVVLQQTFADALALCTPENRSKTLVAAKNEARRQMERASRNLARVISGQDIVSAAQRVALGLSVRRTSAPALPVPTETPFVVVESVMGNAITIGLRDMSKQSGRARPRGVAGAALFFATGEHPPASLNDWVYYGNTTVTRATITIDGVPPNTSVWTCAKWYSPRGHHGPACPPAQTYTTHAGPQQRTSILPAARAA